MGENGGLTLREVWRLGTSRLAQAGIEEASADAELLLLHVLGKRKAELLRDWQEPLPAGLAAPWEALLRRRETGEPVQYIAGEQYFYGRRFAVTPAVLIPRPETELLAEAVLAAGDWLWPGAAGTAGDGADGGGAADCDAGGPESEWGDGADGETGVADAAPVVLDVGTGSGALAVTLAAERPAWRVIASDLSPDALAVARRNAAAHGVEGRIRFVQGDLLAPFLAGGDDASGGVPIDVLVSNPPYIPSGDVPGLQREVREFEPHLALDGGQDGLNPYRRMTAQLAKLPRLPRLVAFEVGAGQAEDVAALLREAASWSDVRFVLDYAGIQRHVVAVR